MQNINYLELENNLEKYVDMTSSGHQALLISKNKKNKVVLISLKELNSIMETSYLQSSSANKNHILDSLRDLELGLGIEKELIEL